MTVRSRYRRRDRGEEPGRLESASSRYPGHIPVCVCVCVCVSVCVCLSVCLYVHVMLTYCTVTKQSKLMYTVLVWWAGPRRTNKPYSTSCSVSYTTNPQQIVEADLVLNWLNKPVFELSSNVGRPEYHVNM